MKPFHMSHFWLFIHILAMWLIMNKCSAESPLDKAEIDKLYKVDHKSVGKIRQGIDAIVMSATCRANGKKVALKCEIQVRGKKSSNLKTEREVYTRLQESHGNLIKYHLVNLINYGTYEVLDELKKIRKCDVLIFDQFDTNLPGLRERNRKKDKTWSWPWPTVCKIMTDVLIALEKLHGVDIAHSDLQYGNVGIGSEPEPKGGAERKEDITYNTDYFLFDFGRSIDLRVNENYSRRDNIADLSKILQYLLLPNTISCPDIFGPFKLSKKKSNLEEYIKQLNDKPLFKLFKEVPEEKGKLHAISQFFILLVKLYDYETEEEIKKVIDYNEFRKLFAVSGQDKGDGKSEDKKQEKKRKSVDSIDTALTKKQK